MEWFAGAGASSPTTTSYVTPVKPSKVNLADLTPPGAPKARSRLSRVELARELLSRTAATAGAGPPHAAKRAAPLHAPTGTASMPQAQRWRTSAPRP